MHPLDISSDLETRLDAAGLAFLAEFYEIALGSSPADVEVLSELGHVYTRLGRLEDGLEVDHRLVRLVPGNPNVHYNLACSLALLRRDTEALDALEAAVGLGYADASFLESDSDLETLHQEPRFRLLVERLKSQA